MVGGGGRSRTSTGRAAWLACVALEREGGGRGRASEGNEGGGVGSQQVRASAPGSRVAAGCPVPSLRRRRRRPRRPARPSASFPPSLAATLALLVPFCSPAENARPSQPRPALPRGLHRSGLFPPRGRFAQGGRRCSSVAGTAGVTRARAPRARLGRGVGAGAHSPVDRRPFRAELVVVVETRARCCCLRPLPYEVGERSKRVPARGELAGRRRARGRAGAARFGRATAVSSAARA